MCVEASDSGVIPQEPLLYIETICLSLGLGASWFQWAGTESQGTPSCFLLPRADYRCVCCHTQLFTWALWMSLSFSCFCSKPLKSHLGSVSEAALPWARDVTFLHPAFSVNWRNYDLSGEVVVGLMGWNIDTSPCAFDEAWVAWMHWLQEDSAETGCMRS